ncbi:MAG TPA: UvrD-helicase domain-containing protein [Solirubrobacterales bacterium]|nr:UvrD-helicase domain-containing protein [Solirubrobacterales bacterium]
MSTATEERTERRPTPEQEAAIAASAPRVLIEAGAGSGKTGVMVDRYCRLVCDQGVEPEAVLAITFTEKAAAELRERVRTELGRRAGEGSARAQELLGAIGGAWITTIHGFCHRVLAAHPVAAGVDPRFSVLDPAEAERAAHEAFDEALEEFVGEGDPGREELVAAYGSEALREMIVGAHEELRSRGARAPRLPEPPPSDPAAALRRAAEVAAAALAELGEKSKARPLVERAVELLAARGEEIGVDELASLRSKSTAKGMDEYCEAIDAALARVAEAGEGGAAYGDVKELLRLFAGGYEEAKARRRGLDFEDLQLLAAGLLSQDEIGRSYRARFRHVMIDEFQDTNRLQLRLVESLRGPETSLVVVGDLLQSIYGFRHADLDVFREQRAQIDADPRGQVIELSGNFRSRPEVIGAVNAFGAELIGDSYQPLTVGLAPEGPPPGDGAPAVELLLTRKPGWEDFDLEPAVDSGTPPHYLAEARALAQRLRDLVDSGVERGEIVLLLRAFTHLGAYEDSLARAGLRPYVVGGRGYWSQQQVSDVCALLATIANPLDDQALFGALASPACGVTPDTLWLLRAAAGRSRHVWGAVTALAGGESEGLAEPERLGDVEAADAALIGAFVERIEALRRLGTRVPLAELIDRAVKLTGYDLAVLLKPAGEARFANVRKLMQIASEFEAAEGRDLRGLLDYLAFREVAGEEAEAATAAEDHDGVRIMSIHRAKGLEFPVVAVAHLDRNLTSGGRAPLLTFGRDGDPRIGMQWRRLGARSINLFSHTELCEDENERDAEEGLRLFHVAATRAQERLILSGVVAEKANGLRPSTSALERIVRGFEIDRDEDSTVSIPPPRPRPGLELELELEPSTLEVRVSAPSPERVRELTAVRPAPGREAEAAAGPAPLRRPAGSTVPSRPLSYTAISAYEECAYRFYMERVLNLTAPETRRSDGEETAPSAREERTARGAAVHALLEWSQANDWAEPSLDLAERHAEAAGLTPSPRERLSKDRSRGLGEDLLQPVRQWIESPLRERIAAEATRVRAEVPLLLGVGGTVLRGSIDLLVEREGAPPLVIDYKTDRLDGADPAERAERYETQRTIYALAVAEALGASEVEVAYVFLERAAEPAAITLDAAAMAAAREKLAGTIARIGRGEFPVAAPERRDWSLCRGCPALRGLCSGPSAPGLGTDLKAGGEVVEP